VQNTLPAISGEVNFSAGKIFLRGRKATISRRFTCPNKGADALPLLQYLFADLADQPVKSPSHHQQPQGYRSKVAEMAA
jgi:hypothetical protein